MFDRHEIVYSNGAGTESVHPSAGLDAMDTARLDELFRMFPQLQAGAMSCGPHARTALQPYGAEMSMAM